MIVLIVIGISYALLKKNIFGEKGNIVYHTGDLDVILDEDSTENLELVSQVPILDEEGIKSEKAYRFHIVNKGKKSLNYQIMILVKNVVSFKIIK